MTTKTEITKDAQLVPGDVIELHFAISALTWVRATELAVIEDKLKSDPRYWLKSSSYLPYDNPTEAVYTIQIVQPPADQVAHYEAGVSPAMIIGAVLAISIPLIFYLTAGKIYKITETLTQTPEGKMVLAGTGIGIGALGIGILVFVVFMVIGKFKGLKT